MKPGNKLIFSIFVFAIFCNTILNAEDRILSSPLINLEGLKPSFEEEEEVINDKSEYNTIQDKKDILIQNDFSTVKLIGLDKITAKTSEIIIKLGETKKFGPLEIKVLECGKVYSNEIINSVAYIQVKDLSKIDNEKVFIFNGWTFSSDPTIAPFDHAIYDLQLVYCEKV